MNTEQSARLRDADPAARIDVDAVCPGLEEIALHARAHVPAPRGRGPRFVTPRRRRGVRLLAAATILVGLLAVGNIVGVPGSGGDSIAYGVTARPDGSVDVRIGGAALYDPAKLQAQLNSAGVRAVVLVESPAGKCDQPARAGDSSSSKAIGVQAGGVLTIHPRKFPADATLVLSLPFAGEFGPQSSMGFLRVMVLRGTPPTCVPQSAFAAPGGSPAPDQTGVAAPSPAVPTPLPSPVVQDGFALQSFDAGGVLIMTLNQDARLHAAELENALRSAGVSAMVLVAGSDRGCHTQADGGVVPDGAFQPYNDRSTVIRPGLLPQGSTVIIALAPNPTGQTFSPWEEMYVATGHAPTCVVSTASPTPS